MLDIGWSELLVVGVVALIVVGPKELPRLFRTVGQFVGKARSMAREFQRAMERAADEAGVNEVRDSFTKAASVRDLGLDDIRDTLNPLKDTERKSAKKPAAAAATGSAAKTAKTTTAPKDAAPSAGGEAAPAAEPRASSKKADVKAAQKPDAGESG